MPGETEKQEPHFSELAPWKRDWTLFWDYVKITSVVIGGGYAIIAAAQADFAAKRKWITDDDILEMVTITQTIPGILACNSAIYIGWKVDRFRGAVAALTGSVLPSLVIIMLVAAGMRALPLDNPHVQGAFTGIISAITGMVLITALKLRKKSITGLFSKIAAAVCFIGMAILHIPSQYLILAAIAAGLLCFRLGKGKAEETES